MLQIRQRQKGFPQKYRGRKPPEDKYYERGLQFLNSLKLLPSPHVPSYSTALYKI